MLIKTNTKEKANIIIKNELETPQNLTPFQKSTLKRLRTR